MKKILWIQKTKPKVKCYKIISHGTYLFKRTGKRVRRWYVFYNKSQWNSFLNKKKIAVNKRMAKIGKKKFYRDLYDKYVLTKHTDILYNLFNQELPKIKDPALKKILENFLQKAKLNVEAESRYLIQDILYHFEYKHYVEVYFYLPEKQKQKEITQVLNYCDILVPNLFAIEVKGANRHQENEESNKRQTRNLKYACKTDDRFKGAEILKISINGANKKMMTVFDLIKLLNNKRGGI